MLHINIAITIGHNVGNQQKHDSEDVLEKFTALTGVQNYTAIDCRGMYNGMPENSTRILINYLTLSEAEAIEKALPQVAASLQQESILIECGELSDLCYAQEVKELAK